MVAQGGDDPDAEACDDTMAEFAVYEQACGVPVNDIHARLNRFCRETEKWRQRNL